MTNDQREIRRKLRILQHAEKTGSVSKTFRYFRIGHRDDPADKCFQRPEREKSARNPADCGLANNRQQQRDQGKVTRPDKGADDVEGHAAFGALCEKANKKLRQQPAKAQHSARRAHRINAAG